LPAPHWRGKMTDKAWTVATLADAWGCSPGHIKNLIKRGDLRCFRVGNLIRITNEEKARCESQSGSNTSAERSSSDGADQRRLQTIEMRAAGAAVKTLAN